MNIITGYRGTPHITSDQDRAKNQGAFGTGSYILDVGDKMAAEIVSANEIRIRDGVLSMQGCVANIEEGAYDICEISNGTQGMQRRDLIVARYTKDAETNVEDIQLVVIEGTPASSSPSDPSYNSGDIQAGDSPVDFPLYRVNINGVNISGVTQLAPFVRTQAETDALIGDTSISGIGGGTLTGAVSALNGKFTVKSYTVNPTDNSTVSPFTTYAETTIPSADRTAYGTPVAIMTAGGGSANPALVRMSGTGNGFWVYAKTTASVDVYILFMK